MNPIQVTAYGLKSIISLLFGHVPQADAKSTMNERLDILGTARPTATEKVRLGLIMAGNKGHRMVPGVDGIPLTSIQDHLATHASLYNPMPMCIRPVDDDLPLEQRKKYALRREFTRNGEPCYEYYALRADIDPDDIKIIMQKVTKEPGQPEVIEPFVPDSTDLYPEPVALPTTGAVVATDVSIRVSAVVNIKFTEDEIEEYINAAKIIYGGDERYAIMSEFALCMAADRVVTAQSTSGQINFNEAIGTQVYNFAMDYKAVYYNTQELDIDFEVGNQIPLLGTASIATLETIGVTIP